MNLSLGFGLDKYRVQDATLLNYPPAYNLATLWLDGSIVDVEGAKYFVDKKAGNNVLITGYDFPTGWVSGFPYKSAATIDIFGQTGVPVVSLYQNFDYADQFFCKHVAQVVDGNGVETSQAYVAEIVAYSEALTGTDLTDANTYFGVPVIDANAKWIDPVNGVDATGNGTKALPYKTHAKILTLTLTEGTLIYCRTGTIAPIAWNKNYSLKGIGFIKILNVSGARGIDYDPEAGKTLAQTIEGYMIDMADVDAYPFNGNPVGYPLTLKRMYFLNYSRAINSATANTQLVTTKDVIFKQGTNDWANYQNKNLTMDGCLVFGGKYAIYKDNNSDKQVKFINSKTTALIFGRLYYALDLDIIGSIVFWTSSFWEQTVGTTGGVFRFIGSYFKKLSTGTFIDFSTYRLTSIDIDGCTFETETAAGLNLVNIVDTKFNRNFVKGSVKYLNVTIATDAADIAHTFEVTGNRFENITVSPLTVGREDAVGYDKGTGVISKNCFIGSDFSSHGIFADNAKDTIMKWNRTFGAGFGCGFKSASTADHANGGMLYNILHNAELLLKGVTNLKVYNNTVFFDADKIAYGSAGANIDSVNCLTISANVAVQTAGADIKNNICIYLGTGSTFRMVRNDNGANANTFDYNIYYCPNTPLLFLENGVDKTFAQWQALGYDTHSIVLTDAQFNALFTDYATGDFSLKAGSIAIALGVDLGATYDDGLDASTNWGNATTLPAIVTKQQAAAWDCGAYVH